MKLERPGTTVESGAVYIITGGAYPVRCDKSAEVSELLRQSRRWALFPRSFRECPTLSNSSCLPSLAG